MVSVCEWVLGDGRKGCLAVAQLWLQVWQTNEFHVKCFECLEKSHRNPIHSYHYHYYDCHVVTSISLWSRSNSCYFDSARLSPRTHRHTHSSEPLCRPPPPFPCSSGCGVNKWSEHLRGWCEAQEERSRPCCVTTLLEFLLLHLECSARN